jgi:hypothetical protein
LKFSTSRTTRSTSAGGRPRVESSLSAMRATTGRWSSVNALFQRPPSRRFFTLGSTALSYISLT